MTPLQNVLKLIRDTVTSSVHQDLVPEGVTEPACAVSFISVDETRVLSGDIGGTTNTFRVAVVASDDNDVKSIVETLETLDNTRNTDFSRIFSRLINWEARESNQPYRRAFVDVRVYQ